MFLSSFTLKYIVFNHLDDAISDEESSCEACEDDDDLDELIPSLEQPVNVPQLVANPSKPKKERLP